MFNWGLPQRKVNRVVAKYPKLAVVTMLAVAGKKSGRAFEFNKESIKLLGLSEEVKKKEEENGILTIAFAFGSANDADGVYVMNATGTENPAAFRFGRVSSKVSNKPTYDAIIDKFGLNEGEDNEFVMVDTGESFAGRTVFALRPITAEEAATATSNEQRAVESTQDLFDTTVAPEEEFSLGEGQAFSADEEVEDAPFADDPFLDAALDDAPEFPTASAEEAFL